MLDDTLVIGIDAGGTSTSLCARTLDGAPDVSLRGPAANALRHGVEHTAEVLAGLIRDAQAQRPHTRLRAIFAGVAGAASPSIQASLTKRIQVSIAGGEQCSITVNHDGVIALEAAFEGLSGLLFIAGTGSAVFALTTTAKVIHAGGWGYIIGDEGSGHMLARDGLAAVAHTIDGGPVTTLSNLLWERFKIASRQDLLSKIFDKNWPIQQVAPLVLEAAEEGDVIATAIVHRQTHALARQATWLLAHTPQINPRYALCGGLSKSDYYLAVFQRAMQTLWPEAVLHYPSHTGLEGAVRLALKQLT